MIIKFLLKTLDHLRLFIRNFSYYLYRYSGVNQKKFSFDSKKDFFQFQSQISTIPGMITDLQGSLLYNLSAFGQIKGDIVEIGSWLGKSTIYLGTGCKTSRNGVVHAVDTFKGNIGKTFMYQAPLTGSETIFDRFLKNIAMFGLSSYVKTYKMTSKRAREKIKKKVRLVFIDASHEYKDVKSDIALWSPLIKKGGLVVLDDHNSSFPGVVKAVKEKILNSNQYKVILLQESLLIAQKII